MEQIKNESAYMLDINDVMIKLDNVRVILDKLTNDYGFPESTAPTRKGVYDWFTNSGERTKQESNSVKWVEDYEYIFTMLHVISDYVFESHKIIDTQS